MSKEIEDLKKAKEQALKDKADKEAAEAALAKQVEEVTKANEQMKKERADGEAALTKDIEAAKTANE